jgi:flagellum-specific peptidoglycan hydrolase FlgJ
MKEAVSRITTAEGTQFNHAYYVNWRESVYDYAFYQNRYLTNVRTESEYYAMLSASYAEASNYVEVLKSTVEKQNLKSLF